jgi:hypothetical protein
MGHSLSNHAQMAVRVWIIGEGHDVLLRHDHALGLRVIEVDGAEVARDTKVFDTGSVHDFEVCRAPRRRTRWQRGDHQARRSTAAHVRRARVHQAGGGRCTLSIRSSGFGFQYR